MSGDPALSALAARAQVLPVTMAVEESDDLRKLALDALRAVSYFAFA